MAVRGVAQMLWFEPNRGQANAAVQVVAHTRAGYVYIGRDQVALDVRMGLARASSTSEAVLGEPTGGISSYFQSRDEKDWRTRHLLALHHDFHARVDVAQDGSKIPDGIRFAEVDHGHVHNCNQIPREPLPSSLENVLTFISLTRLRVRSIRFLPLFAVQAFQALRQVKKASGFQTGGLLRDRDWTFWTMTAWDSQESMRQYMTTGAHKKAMPHLMNWCDEASVAHWQQEENTLPTWEQADRRMRESGRASKVRHPSPQHASLTYRTPRTSSGGPINRA